MRRLLTKETFNKGEYFNKVDFQQSRLSTKWTFNKVDFQQSGLQRREEKRRGKKRRGQI